MDRIYVYEIPIPHSSTHTRSIPSASLSLEFINTLAYRNICEQKWLFIVSLEWEVDAPVKYHRIFMSLRFCHFLVFTVLCAAQLQQHFHAWFDEVVERERVCTGDMQTHWMQTIMIAIIVFVVAHRGCCCYYCCCVPLSTFNTRFLKSHHLHRTNNACQETNSVCDVANFFWLCVYCLKSS